MFDDDIGARSGRRVLKVRGGCRAPNQPPGSVYFSAKSAASGTRTMSAMLWRRIRAGTRYAAPAQSRRSQLTRSEFWSVQGQLRTQLRQLITRPMSGYVGRVTPQARLTRLIMCFGCRAEWSSRRMTTAGIGRVR
jgi:hypothetical protein